MPVDVQRLRSEKLYEVNSPLEAVAIDLVEIATIGAAWHKKRPQLQWAGFAAWVFGFAFGWIQPLVGLVVVALGVYLFYSAKSYPKQVSKDDRYTPFAQQVVAMLASDTHPKTAVAIRIAFAPERKLLSEGAVLGTRNGVEKHFSAQWFSIVTTLLDGSVFNLTVEDLIRERKVTNARGKRKTKTRLRSVLQLHVGYPAELYGDVSVLGPKFQ